MSIEKILLEFISSKEPSAIAIQGAWGAGKTYFWKNKIETELLIKPWKKKYSYISLFGINSLTELKTAIAVATDEFDRDAINKKRNNNFLFGWTWKAIQWLGDILRIVPRSGKALGDLYERIGFYLVRNRIICFDDVERHGKKLELIDFLGLVTYLSEQRSCRVAVIINPDLLSDTDKSTWLKYHEKVFSGEVTYTPKIDETISLILKNESNQPWHEHTCTSLKKLEISNIRIIQKISRFMNLAWQLAPESSKEKAAEQMGRAIPLLVWSTYGSSDDAPPLDFILGRGRFDPFSFVKPKDDTRSLEEKVWSELLNNYGYYPAGTLDEAIIDMIKKGFPDSEMFAIGFADLSQEIELSRRKDIWNDAWKLYHSSVSDNQIEMIEAFSKAWPLVADHEHATNLQSTARLMRLLGRADLATSFIEQWVRARTGNRVEELSPRELHSFNVIDDSEIIEACSNAIADHENKPINLLDAFEKAKESISVSDEVAQAFSAATVDEIIHVFDNSSGEDFARTIKKLAQLSANPEGSRMHIGGKKVIEACKLLAKKSALNSDRMRSWIGIETDAKID